MAMPLLSSMMLMTGPLGAATDDTTALELLNPFFGAAVNASITPKPPRMGAGLYSTQYSDYTDAKGEYLH